MPDQSKFEPETSGGSAAARIALKVSELHADLLHTLHEEIGTNGTRFADAAQQLVAEFGSLTAAAVEALDGSGGSRGDTVGSLPAVSPEGVPPASPNGNPAQEQAEELPSLYQPGHMRRRLEQLLETNRRYGHPFGIAVFDAHGPGTRPGDVAGGQETVLSIVGAALRDSIRIVDEAFRLEEDAICVLAPNISTVEGVQMCERLLGQLDDLERAGGLRICVSAGVVACPDHGADAEDLLHKADAAMWRAKAVGQPVGVGALQDR
ncbi:MAG TPA: GGDEF domain-containing protein [Solirubrobacterales bacterium]|nr:GGDEF domain-containing protein [Solirubrobacterales bacterium]